MPPLPYLSWIMEKVKHKYVQKTGHLPWIFSAASPLFDLEYADDTALLGRSAEVVETFLELLISEAKQVGLLLNFDKCKHIAVRSSNNIRIIYSKRVLFGYTPKG